MKESINRRLKTYEIRTPCMIATILNPHLKKMGFKMENASERAVAAIQREYSSYLVKKSSISASPEINHSNLEEEITATKKSKPDKLLYFLNAPQKSNSTADAIVDIRQYVEKPIIPKTDFPIEYWNHSDNNLKEIALTYPCIPATSTPAERIFSKAGLIMTDRRSRLSSKHLYELLFINQNSPLFE